MSERISPAIVEHIQWAELAGPPLQPLHTGAVVLTGRQCSGKTTLINELARRGCSIVPEGLRDVFEGGVKAGFKLADLKTMLPEITTTCLAQHVAKIIEASKSGSQIVTDRGFGDLLAGLLMMRYAASTPALFRNLIPRLFGEGHYWNFLKDQDMPELRARLDHQIENLKGWSKAISYDRVLWLEPMPHLERDGVRVEGLATRLIVPYFIKQAWRELGYELESVPAYYGRFEERVRHVQQLLPATHAKTTNHSVQAAAQSPAKSPTIAGAVA